MSGNGIFGIGTSALQAYQRALQVTGNNIANVGTDGYSRQRIDLSARAAQQTGVGSIGTGVDITNVGRVIDQFVELRLLTNTSGAAYHQTLGDLAMQLDKLLADPDAGLAPALSRFFAAAQDVASDPTSAAARQMFLAEAQALTDRFAQLEGRIDDQRNAVNGGIKAIVGDINELAGAIARINKEIVETRGRMGGGREPSDLLDRRDILLRELAERVNVSTVMQDDGSLNVFIGNGQPLVLGYTATELFAHPMGADPERLDIGFRTGAASVIVTDRLSGGKLGALMDGRDMLDDTSNQLGRLAIGLADQINAVHTGNMDLSGELGDALFRYRDPQILAGTLNTATGRPSLIVQDSSALRASDYQLRFNGSAWELMRLADDRVIGTIAPGDTLSFDGLHIDTGTVAGATSGDVFLLRPMRTAGHLDVLISDPRAVAAALPVAAAAQPDNAGAARVHALSVVDVADAALRAPVTIAFEAGNYVIEGTNYPFVSGGDTVIEHNGWRLTLRGTPAEGDSITVGDNAGAVGDNRGMLALADVANERLLNGGTATLFDSYGALVADVGSRTRRAQLNSSVHQQLLADAISQREQVSGVNLDEEAANMLRFQQAYQAAAQVIAVAGTMFDTLLAAVRR